MLPVPRDAVHSRWTSEELPLTAFARMGFTRHERRVLSPLLLTGFFETYDVALLTLAAPVLAEGLGLGIGAFGIGVAVIRLASLASVPILRLADRWGRRALLLISLAVFTIATGMTALTAGIVAFVLVQMVARVFQATESSLAGLVIAEELRPHRRGAGISALGVVSGLGFGAVAGLLLLVPLTPLGWRLFYLVALLPLVLVAYLRRNLRETRAFAVARAQNRLQTSFWPRVDRAQRSTCLRALALVSAFGLVQTPCFLYASELAQTTYGWSGRFTLTVVLAGVFGVLGYLLGGHVSDRVGRKPIVAAAILLAVAGTVLVFTRVEALFIPGFFLATAAAACFLAVTLAYLAELFPTEIRATLISVVISSQVAAGSLGLVIVGALAAVVAPSSLLLFAGAGLAASLLLLRGLPEVGGKDLVQAARDGDRAGAQLPVPALQPA